MITNVEVDILEEYAKPLIDAGYIVHRLSPSIIKCEGQSIRVVLFYLNDGLIEVQDVYSSKLKDRIVIDIYDPNSLQECYDWLKQFV